MNADKLKNILADHKVWVESLGKSGKRADLSYADLTGADLSYTDLRCANLNGANLYYANLFGAYLTGAHFELEIKTVNNFRYAIFSESAIPWVILHSRWSADADTVTFV